MNGSLALVAYRGLVAGVPTGRIDIQTRWFESTDIEHIRSLIQSDPIHTYKNPEGETVTWELVEIFAIEKFAPGESGEEVVGFIASTNELSQLA